MSANSLSILDTLKFKDQKIFLKEFHAQRTHEALGFKGIETSLEKIYERYDEIEKKYVSLVQPNQILRLSFHGAHEVQIEVVEKTPFPTSPVVEVVSTFVNPSGLGEQNFKWTARDQWQYLLSLKNPAADEVIAVNDKGQITETSRCNIFCFDPITRFAVTPALDSGCINGVYRRFAIANGVIELPGLGRTKVVEKNILASEIKNYSLFLANSVREVLPAKIL